MNLKSSFKAGTSRHMKDKVRTMGTGMGTAAHFFSLLQRLLVFSLSLQANKHNHENIG